MPNTRIPATPEPAQDRCPRGVGVPYCDDDTCPGPKCGITPKPEPAQSEPLGTCDGDCNGGFHLKNRPHAKMPICRNWRPIAPPTVATSGVFEEVKSPSQPLSESQLWGSPKVEDICPRCSAPRDYWQDAATLDGNSPEELKNYCGFCGAFLCDKMTISDDVPLRCYLWAGHGSIHKIGKWSVEYPAPKVEAEPELSEGVGWPIGWCSSCDYMTSRGNVISGRPACDKCGDWLIFDGVDIPNRITEPAASPVVSEPTLKFDDNYSEAAYFSGITFSQATMFSMAMSDLRAGRKLPWHNSPNPLVTSPSSEGKIDAGELTAIDVIQAIKRRIHFIGWPNERKDADGRPDWRKEIELIERFLAQPTHPAKEPAGGKAQLCPHGKHPIICDVCTNLNDEGSQL